MSVKKVLIGAFGGIGDLIQSINCAHFVQERGYAVDILCFARDETFRPLIHLFGDRYNFIQHPKKEEYAADYWILNNKQVLKQEYPNYDEWEFHAPDLLYRQFNWRKYDIHPQTIRSARLLTHLWTPNLGRKVYLALNTSTPEYFYPHTEQLLNEVATALPRHCIYFNDITEWAGHKIENNVDSTNLRKNIYYIKNDDWDNSIQNLKESSYCICLDNGISHIAYAMGIPRLLISNRLTNQGIMWQARWYEDTRECLPYTYTPKLLANVVKFNVETPETTLIDRRYIADNPNFVDWDKALLFKF